MKSKNIAVILTGCGNQDGTEISEAIALFFSLSFYQAKVTCFAPNEDFQPKNYITREKLNENRNILIESARLSRGQIQPLQNLRAEDFDGLAIPGGSGVATALSNWAEKKANCSLNPLVEKIILEFFESSKPIAAICLAPVLIAKVLGHSKVEITLGDDHATMQEAAKTGALLVTCPASDFITDRDHKIISTPAYMDQNARPHQIYEGISGLVKEFIEMA